MAADGHGQPPLPTDPAPQLVHSVMCFETEALIGRLRSLYGETLQSYFLTTTRNVIQVFAAPDFEDATATVILTRVDGLSCIIAAGRYYTEVDEGPSLPPESEDEQL